MYIHNSSRCQCHWDCKGYFIKFYLTDRTRFKCFLTQRSHIIINYVKLSANEHMQIVAYFIGTIKFNLFSFQKTLRTGADLWGGDYI